MSVSIVKDWSHLSEEETVLLVRDEEQSIAFHVFQQEGQLGIEIAPAG